MWDVDNFSVLTENVETKDFSKWQAIKRIYLSELHFFRKMLTICGQTSILKIELKMITRIKSGHVPLFLVYFHRKLHEVVICYMMTVPAFKINKTEELHVKKGKL